MILGVFLSFFLLVIVHGEVFNLDSQTIQTLVQDTDDVWFVSYQLGSNEGVEPLANLFGQYGIKFGLVDCQDEGNKKLCSSVRGIQFQLFADPSKMNPYTKKNYRAPIPFVVPQDSKGIEVKAIERFVAKSYPSQHIHVAKTISELDEIRTKSSLPTVLLFSEKSAVTMLFKSVGFYFIGRLNFVQVAKSSDIAKHFEVSSFPTLGLLPPSGEMVEFDGDEAEMKDRNSLVAWLEKFATPREQKTSDNSEKDEGDTAQKFAAASLKLDDLSLDAAILGCDCAGGATAGHRFVGENQPAGDAEESGACLKGRRAGRFHQPTRPPCPTGCCDR